MSFPALSAKSKLRSIALGNPSVAPQSTPHMYMNSNVWPHASSADPGCKGSTLFLVNADPTIYDSGFRVLVTYYPNPMIADCEENELINIEVDSSMSMYIFKTEILPQLSLDSFITKVVMATQRDGSVSVAPDTSPTLRCLGTPFPPGFTHQGIPISDLCRLPEHDIENIVVRKDIPDSPLYVFKHDMDIATLTTHFDHQSDTLLQEALFLTRLDSPFILRPSALITDANEHFRGYLLPYQPAGSLANVLSKISLRTVPALEAFSASCSYSPDSLSIPPPVANLDWEIKHAWAVDIASGIDYLHKQNTSWGDVKLDNIVLSSDGRCRLIDCAPIMGMSTPYAAPEMEDLFHSPSGRLTAARDEFALGLVLWALAEETGHFKRVVDFVTPRLSWTTGNGFAPMWYQDMVNQCMTTEPSERPTAPQIVDILSRFGSL